MGIGNVCPINNVKWRLKLYMQVWRFPYLAYKNGGGAFLVPYFIILILVGKPMYYMETAIGQFARLSPLQIWRCAPIATGVGVAMLVLCSIIAIYYNVIMAYSIIYIGASFRGITEDLPWSYCGEWWGADENCVTRGNVTEDQADQLRLKRWENVNIFHLMSHVSPRGFCTRFVPGPSVHSINKRSALILLNLLSKYLFSATKAAHISQ